jgi:hypothetical protein
VPQHTSPPVQSATPTQWKVATSEPQETVLVGRQYAASGPPSAGRQDVFDLRSQGLPQLSTTYAPDELAPLDPEDDPDDVPEDVPDELDEPLELGPDERAKRTWKSRAIPGRHRHIFCCQAGDGASREALQAQSGRVRRRIWDFWTSSPRSLSHECADGSTGPKAGLSNSRQAASGFSPSMATSSS